MKARVFLIIAITILFIYLISFGPGLYLAVKTEKYWDDHHGGNGELVRLAAGAIVIIYSPHVYAMALFEPYFFYNKWWIEAAGEKMNADYSGFRDRVLK